MAAQKKWGALLPKAKWGATSVKDVPDIGSITSAQVTLNDFYALLASGNATFAGTVTANSIIRTFTGVQETDIDTSESTTSAVATDLATVGPTVSVTIGPSGQAMVAYSCLAANNTDLSHFCYMTYGYYLSGSSGTFVEVNKPVISQSLTNSNLITGSRVHLLSGLTPGTRSFKARYRGSVNDGTLYSFIYRTLMVMPL